MGQAGAYGRQAEDDGRTSENGKDSPTADAAIDTNGPYGYVGKGIGGGVPSHEAKAAGGDGPMAGQAITKRL